MNFFLGLILGAVLGYAFGALMFYRDQDDDD